MAGASVLKAQRISSFSRDVWHRFSFHSIRSVDIYRADIYQHAPCSLLKKEKGLKVTLCFVSSRRRSGREISGGVSERRPEQLLWLDPSGTQWISYKESKANVILCLDADG